MIATGIDQLTKLWAVRTLAGEVHSGTASGFFSLQLVHNSGAAFSLGQDNTWVFSLLAVTFVGAIGWWLASGRVTNAWLAFILGLIAGGAVGNLIDRLAQPPGFGQGHVVDFINYNDWFVGNVADIWIVGGAAALVLYLLFDKEPAKNEDENQPDSAIYTNG